MEPIDQKLFAWRQLYLKLVDARLRWRQAVAGPSTDSELARSEAEVNRIEEQTKFAFTEVDRARSGSADPKR